MNRSNKLDELLEQNELDAFLLFDDSYSNQNMFYLTNLLAPVPFIYFKRINEKEKIIVPRMEMERAKEKTKAEVINLDEFLDERDYIKAMKKLIKESKNTGVPEDFPLKIANELNAELETIDVSTIRRKKSSEEIDKIKKAQEIAEKGIKKAINVLKNSEVRKNKVIFEGEPLTSEKLKYVIEKELLKNNAVCEDIIVSSGEESANPHESGSGILSPSPIVIDVFPTLKKERYCGDITRTFSLNPSNELKKTYSDVLEAQKIASNEIKAGVDGSEIHSAVEEHFTEKNYGVRDKENEINFLHSTGHGVGLDVHEAPRISEKQEELKKGDVVTVEPGLYGKNIGGIRIEDLVVVREDGIDNLTELEKRLVL